MSYANLNDAANSQDLGDFMSAGDVKIWYYKDEFSRDACMGREFCEKHGFFKIDINDLTKTHVLLGGIKTSTNYLPGEDMVQLEDVFTWMQGEVWSPNGEAREFIRGLGISHTSMSVGDIVETPKGIFLVDRVGFIKLN